MSYIPSNQQEAAGAPPRVFDAAAAVATAVVPHPRTGEPYNLWVVPDRTYDGGPLWTTWVRRAAGVYRPDQRSFLTHTRGSEGPIGALRFALSALETYEPWGIDATA